MSQSHVPYHLAIALKGVFHAHIQKIANKYDKISTDTIAVVFLFLEISADANKIIEIIANIVVETIFTINITSPPLLSLLHRSQMLLMPRRPTEHRQNTYHSP